VSEEAEQSIKKWRFYRTAMGAEVARDELRALGDRPRAAVTDAIKRRRRGASLPREIEHLRGEVSALRVTFDGCEYRVLYAEVGNNSEVLLGLVVLEKKSKKLPASELKKAERRLKDWCS
jgi:phage-related protein